MTQSTENKITMENVMKRNQMQLDKSDKEKNEEESKTSLRRIESLEESTKQLGDEVNKMQCQKEVILNTTGFKCRCRLRVFAIEQSKYHYRSITNYIEGIRDISNRSLISSNKSNIRLTIVIDRVSREEYGQPYIEYVIEVNYDKKTWRVYKRINQFAALYKSLKVLYDNDNEFTKTKSLDISNDENEKYSSGVRSIAESAHIANIESISQCRVFRLSFVFEEYESNGNENGNGYDKHNELKDDIALFVESTLRNHYIRRGLKSERLFEGANDIKEDIKDNSPYINCRNEDKDYN